jgi:protein-S-isoprenylcysteine O-methyltransferase Ste14
MNAVFLGFLWLGYYVLHSAFATDRIKRFFLDHISFAAPYYRMIYSFFATVNFALLAWFHIIVPSRQVFEPGMISTAAGVFLVLAGSLVFWKTARRYGWRFLTVEDAFEPVETAQLHRDGIHKWVRHPLYFGILLFLIALVLFFPSWKNVLFSAISTLYIAIGARLEERKLVRKFGDAYRDYQREVRMLVPWLF